MTQLKYRCLHCGYRRENASWNCLTCAVISCEEITDEKPDLEYYPLHAATARERRWSWWWKPAPRLLQHILAAFEINEYRTPWPTEFIALLLRKLADSRRGWWRTDYKLLRECQQQGLITADRKLVFPAQQTLCKYLYIESGAGATWTMHPPIPVGLLRDFYLIPCTARQLLLNNSDSEGWRFRWISAADAYHYRQELLRQLPKSEIPVLLSVLAATLEPDSFMGIKATLAEMHS